MAVVSDELLAAVEGMAATVQREAARRSVADSIRRTPGVCGRAACVRQTRIPVWTLIGLQKLGRDERDLLSDFPSLIPADLDAAWAYYRQYPAEIDAAHYRERDGRLGGPVLQRRELPVPGRL